MPADQTPAQTSSESPKRRITAFWSRGGREAEVVVRACGWRVRVYAGHSFSDRPRIYWWAAYGHRGVVVRLRRGVRMQPVWGVQWRPL